MGFLAAPELQMGRPPGKQAALAPRDPGSAAVPPLGHLPVPQQPLGVQLPQSRRGATLWTSQRWCNAGTGQEQWRKQCALGRVKIRPMRLTVYFLGILKRGVVGRMTSLECAVPVYPSFVLSPHKLQWRTPLPCWAGSRQGRHMWAGEPEASAKASKRRSAGSQLCGRCHSTQRVVTGPCHLRPVLPRSHCLRSH